jgi:acyl-CoA thioester hydrolase
MEGSGMNLDEGPGGSVEVRVRVADTDLMGVVYNSVYLVWFEIGLTELMRDRGISYAEVEKRGYSLPVTEAYLKVRRPARYDDLVRIETRVDRLRSRDLTFAYELFRAGDLLVSGWTTHVAVKHPEGRSASLPEWLVEGVRRGFTTRRP